jgi:hypothetical protein
MFNTIVGAGAVGAGALAASRYGSGSGSDQKMRLLAAPAPAPQHWKIASFPCSTALLYTPAKYSFSLRLSTVPVMY